MKPYCVTPALKTDLQTLKWVLAESGFCIFTPALNHKRTEYDFVAIPKQRGNEVLLIRVGRYRTSKGIQPRIEIRSHSAIFLSLPILKRAREKMSHSVRQRHRLPLLPQGVSWAPFVAEEEREEFLRTFPTPPYRW